MNPLVTRRREGSALLVTVLMLVLIGMLGMAALETVTRDAQVAGFQKRSRIAFYAAEAGVSQGRELVRTADSVDDTPPLPLTNLADAGTYPHGQPTFQGDPDFDDPIRTIGSKLHLEGLNLNVNSPALVQDMWQINVLGNSPDGATTRVEAVMGTLGTEALGYGG